MNVLLNVLQAGNLIIPTVELGVDLALKLKHLLELTPNIQVNITTLTGEAIAADEATMQLVADWKQKHGL